MARDKNFDTTAVLQKAQELFWQQGYASTSMQDLVDTLALSRSSIYDTFTDKETLYCKTLQDYSDANAKALATKASSAVSPFLFIQDILHSVIHCGKNDGKQLGCFIVNAGIELANTNNAVRKIVQNNNHIFEEMLYCLIIKGQQLGEIQKEKDAKTIAAVIFNTIIGLKVNLRMGTAYPTLLGIVEETLQQIKT